MEYFKKRMEMQLPTLQAVIVGMAFTFCGGFLLGLVALYA